MRFHLTEEQEQLAATAARYLAEEFDPPNLARLAEAPLRPPEWLEPRWRAATALGWFDPALPLVERVVLAREFGAGLLPLPWWQPLSLHPELAGASAGQPVAFLPEPVTAEPVGAGRWRLSGRVPAVPEAATATSLLVPHGTGLLRVPLPQPGVRLGAVSTADPLRGVADVELADATGETIPVRPESGAAPPAAWTRTLRRRELLLAAEAVGVARHCSAVAAEHATRRSQFGRPIGSYQGVAFGVADTVVRVELAWSLVLRAAWVVHGDATNADLAVHAAVCAARQAAVGNAEQAIQTLGGIGMSWEHPLHWWYRRALWGDGFGAGRADRLESVAARLLPPVPLPAG